MTRPELNNQGRKPKWINDGRWLKRDHSQEADDPIEAALTRRGCKSTATRRMGRNMIEGYLEEMRERVSVPDVDPGQGPWHEGFVHGWKTCRAAFVGSDTDSDG